MCYVLVKASNHLTAMRRLSLYCTQAGNAVQAACVGKGAVLRVSFGNVLFFGVHALALAGVHQVCYNSHVLCGTKLCAVRL